MSEHLISAKATAHWDASQGIGSSHSPDARTIPALLAGILDALIALAESATPTSESGTDEGGAS